MPTLVDLVRRHAHASPQALAIRHRARELEYGRLWEQAEGFARALLAAGLSPGDRVGIVLPNRPEVAVAVYGTWLAGGVVVPLSPQARERDLDAWLCHSGVTQLVHEASHAEAAAAGGRRPGLRCWPVADDGLLPSDPGQAALPAAGADALAAILYTSGTTGAPKGVMLTHANLASNVLAVADYLGLSARDRILSVLPCHYAYGASVLHTHLASGASVHFGDGMLFPQQTLEQLAQSRATGFSGVPSTFALLCDRTDASALDMRRLRYVTQAGGAMSPALTGRVRALFPQASLYVMYGQTEATSRLSWLPPSSLDTKPGSVGRPIAGTELQVVDAEGRRLPAGIEGEVVARGPGVMAGYWNDSEATGRVLREGWLHTGDLGRMDEEGFLWLSGRRDDIIKTGAHRVSPQDVEDVIGEVPGVRESVVVGIEDDVLGQAIAAYVVPEAGASQLEPAIRRHCWSRMAGYKVPKTIHFIDALPRTASGKVRRAALTMEPSAR